MRLRDALTCWLYNRSVGDDRGLCVAAPDADGGQRIGRELGYVRHLRVREFERAAAGVLVTGLDTIAIVK
jgi:hypothetical protein